MTRHSIAVVVGVCVIAACRAPRADAGTGATTGATSAAVTPSASMDTAGTARMPSNGDSLAGDWELVSIPGETFKVTKDAKPATLHFDPAEKHASGNASCNRFMGPYSASGDSLSFGALATTMMACVDDALTRRETAFLAALNATKRYRIEGKKLELIGAKGTVAQLKRPSS